MVGRSPPLDNILKQQISLSKNNRGIDPGRARFPGDRPSEKTPLQI